MKKIKLTFLGIVIAVVSLAQNTQEKEISRLKANLLFGLNQPLLGGFNVEGNLFYKRLVFDYSHGVSLNLDNQLLDEENQAQNIDVQIPWTTGFGIGYRFNEWFNLRAEPKWHKFELYDKGAEQIKENLLGSYTTFTLGIGAYANLQPFKRSDNFLKGIMIAPSIRWWPRVSSSLPDDQLTFFSESLQEEVNHTAMQVGINNTPLIINISLGYSLSWK